jgi:hypothetical protein
MNYLDHNIEQKVADDVREVIGLVNGGISANDAVTKVAEEHGRCPDVVRTICGVFNKSKTVAHLQKSAAGERGGDFELADAAVVLHKIYGDVPVEKTAAEVPVAGFEEIYETLEKEAEATGEGQGVGNERQRTGGSSLCVCPACGNTQAHMREVPCNEAKCSKCGTNMTGVEKRAEEIARFEEAVTKSEKYAGMVKRAMDDFDTRSKTLRYQMDKKVQEIGRRLESMADGQLRKVAQTVVNGYPKIGNQICRLIQSRMSRQLPAVEKTAHAAVFPKEEPYIGIASLYDTAKEILNVESARKDFEKVSDVGEAASKFVRWIADTRTPQSKKKDGWQNKAIDIVSSGVERGATGWRTPGVPGEMVDLLGPEVANSLKELDTKKTFLELALYDKHLNKYPMSELADAYNYAIETIRDPRDLPGLRASMLRLIEQGGYRDVEQVKQETEIAEKRDKNQALVSKQEQDRTKELKQYLEDRLPGGKGEKLVAKPVAEMAYKQTAEAQRTKGTKKSENDFQILKGHVAAGNMAEAERTLKSMKSFFKDRDQSIINQAEAYLADAKTKDKQEATKDQVRQEILQEREVDKTRQEDINAYIAALGRAVKDKDTDKAEDIVEDLVDKYPDVESPQLREIMRDLGAVYDQQAAAAQSAEERQIAKEKADRMRAEVEATKKEEFDKNKFVSSRISALEKAVTIGDLDEAKDLVADIMNTYPDVDLGAPKYEALMEGVLALNRGETPSINATPAAEGGESPANPPSPPSPQSPSSPKGPSPKGPSSTKGSSGQASTTTTPAPKKQPAPAQDPVDLVRMGIDPGAGQYRTAMEKAVGREVYIMDGMDNYGYINENNPKYPKGAIIVNPYGVRGVTKILPSDTPIRYT